MRLDGLVPADKARLQVSPKGRRHVTFREAVHGDVAGTEGAGDTVRAPQVARVEAGRQAVCSVVGNGDGLLLWAWEDGGGRYKDAQEPAWGDSER